MNTVGLLDCSANSIQYILYTTQNTVHMYDVQLYFKDHVVSMSLCSMHNKLHWLPSVI